MAEVTEFTTKTTEEAADTPPEHNPTPAKARPGRPPKGSHRATEVRQPQFFDAVAAVHKDDWGTRAFMYVYADEPVCKAKTFGSTRYLMKSSVPIYDLEQLKEDYGSFKGWMSLNLRKTGKDQTAEVDRLDFEIYDPKYPPKIPRAAWANDSRNERWIALLPPEPPPVNAAVSNLMEGAKFYKEIRQEFKEEMADAEPEVPATDQTRSTLETMKLAKDLFAPATPAATAPPADPFDTAKKIMDMRGNDPMIAALMQRLDAADKAQEKARDREFELMKELRQTATKAPEPSKGIAEQLLDIAANADKLKPLKDIFGFGGGESVGRAARTTGMDILNSLVSGPAGAQLAQGLGTLMMNLPNMFANGNGANGHQQTAPPVQVLPPIQTPPVPETPEQRIQRIGGTITKPMIGEFFMKNATGADFAQSMYNIWPEDFEFMKSLGAENIVGRYRRFTEAWNAIQYREQDFITFIGEFCAWDPNAEEGPVPPDNGDDGVVDLEEAEG